ncbi:MAG TPA: NAD(P)H-dependent glycerol-3-phosphate dehydrogenase [Thermomicrobiales bacterium]|nr:NAD(P)H-dependent glycerol-3-phosphate dehydrogenase [Thermomicrobiales bacterium]
MSINAAPESAGGERTVVIGAGAWGTTLANLIASTGRDVTLVAHSQAHAEQVRLARENERYLPAIRLSDRLLVTDDPTSVVSGASMVALVVPSQQMRASASKVAPFLSPEAVLVSCAKGLELGTLLRMTEVVADASGVATNRICALSGPNLAREIALGLPASAVVAGSDQRVSEMAQLALGAPSFRLYTSADVVGVELGGALKNIVALGAGVADGLQLGHNAKAAFITRGLAEMIRLGVAAGANPLTFGGLSGLGDLIATCESPLSRNRSFGERLGRGMSIEEAAAGTPHVVEGLTTARAALTLAEHHRVEMPIAATVVSVLDGRMGVRDAIGSLMSRGARPELDAFR